MLILSTVDSTLLDPSQVFCPLNVAVTVTQSWTGSARNCSSINMYLYKLKYSSVFAHFGGLSPLILNLGIRWRSVGSFTSRHIIPCGKTPSVHWMGGGVGPRTSLVAVGNDKNLLSLWWIEQFLTYQFIAYFCVILGIKNWKTKISKLF